MDRIWAERDAVLRSAGGPPKAANDAWREKWHERIDVTDVAVRFDVAFTDIEVLLPQLWIVEDIKLGEISDASAKIFLIFKSHTAFSEPRFGKGHALVITPYKIEGVLLTLADIFGKVPDLGEKIEEYANKAIPTIHRHFAEVVIRMVHNQYKKRFIDCRLQDEHLEVVFCDDPADPGAFPVAEAPAPVEGSIPTVTSRVRREVVGPRDLIDAGDTPPPEPVGVVPSWFYLGTAAGLAQLDNVETIIVVMMENRSFDHMVGRLNRKWPDRGYICYPDGVSNSVPGRSPVKMVPARDIQEGTTYYAIRVDPYHGMDHVVDQINNGQMDGFARDIMTKPNPRERIPQVPLTYYDETDLPFFYNTLAGNYVVCDQWFAAHPGGTYPNRWACLSGTMAEVKNFLPDDHRMGFIKLPTISDVLAPYTDVEWIYYETTLGMLRMYDRYRLDSTRVLPFDDKHKGFVTRAGEGTLPPVVFIEPRITGIPPLEQASDDHPPANLLRGQEFLQDVYRALIAPREFSQWGKCMLVITYDEHGGVFDHVAPPGTPLGPEEWRPVAHPDGRIEYKVPLIHPEGKRFMGARVPTFIVSPLVRPGSVSHTVFDHTSIVKTILTRHRAKFRASDSACSVSACRR